MDMTVLENTTPWIQQHNCDLNLLYKFIDKIKDKYNINNVDVVMSPKPSNFKFPDNFKKFNLIRNLDVDKSILFMINSDILILSASTISYTAGLLHKGSQIYYPYCNHYFSYGLNSKLDKSKNFSILFIQSSFPIKKSKSVIDGAFGFPVNINLKGFPKMGNFKLFFDKKLSKKTPINSLSLKFTSSSSSLNFSNISLSICIDVNNSSVNSGSS